MDEFEVINKYFRSLTNNCSAANNLKDDVATVKIAQHYQLSISKDLIVEDIHFKRSDGAYIIANKLLRVNLSDLAACGAKPLYYMLGFSKLPKLDEAFIADFCLGLKEVADQYQLSLIGGDSVTASDKLFFSLTIFGQNKINQNLTRNKAKKGDIIFVSGFIGDAYLGLKITQNKLKSIAKKDKSYLLSRHYKPIPRIELGQKLLENKLANAAIDISDGFLADLNHICHNSNLNAIINQSQIPISAPAKSILENNDDITIANLISAGDDYELIFTASPTNKKQIINISKSINVPITQIGTLEDIGDNKANIKIINQDNEEISIKKYGYKHW